ncbi:PrsW family intramembrane metalloprotease [Pseudarthrobacter sp. H2]|uniref:PrsW family intramembrane metalloprotease n=1 Tax=Pseudarthrobacter sp. H2 TaxID=3418415 RepID=UPI003CEDF2A8
MTSHDPRPDGHPPLPEQANPSWMGHVPEQNYRPAPANYAGRPQATLPPAIPAPSSRRRRGRRSAGGGLGLFVAGAVLVFADLFLVLTFVLANTGVAGFAIGFVASLLPLGSVLLAVYVIDRWEPEPKRLLLFAFVWGAVVSVALTLLLQPPFSLAAGPASGLDEQTFSETLAAPVVEEFAKSLGLLLLLLFARKHFDGPVAGVVFAFTVAGGFAFTENVLYFGRAFSGSGNPATNVAVVFLGRGVMSPFAHAIFTASTGVVLGFAARRGSTGLCLLAFIAGLVPAVLLHSSFNTVSQDFPARYIFVQVPIFVAAVLVIVLLRRAQNRLTRQRLQEYAAAGWFTSAEVQMLGTGRGRSWALLWARSIGRGPQMKAFLRAATRLAFTRQRILSGRDVPAQQLDEKHQLAKVAALRDAVLRR